MTGQATDRNETRDERADRNFGELLQELRVIETGVQVLFSVLLTVPFSQRFDQVTGLQRDVYFAALVLAAVSSVLIIAPATYHRVLFQKGEKPRIVRVSNRLALAGTIFLWLSMTAVLLLVSDVLFHGTAAVIVATTFGAATGLLWFVPPLVRRLEDERR
ncbi:MAG: hypothetical protein JWN35_2912 [Frankiales bacterium]|jgi:hypothetical protein|nr:hypothetical protein [Frankiales bacterium]